MHSLSQEQLLIIIRGLSLYLLDQIKEGDVDNAEKTAKIISEASHSLHVHDVINIISKG
jgi:hypothetical protein